MFITDMIVNVEYETNQVEAPASPVATLMQLAG